MERNRRGIERLRGLVGRLDDQQLLREVPVLGWSVAATLAHLAFWDGWALARWEGFALLGAFEDIPDSVQHLANAAAAEGWRAIPPRAAANLALGSAERVVARISTLGEPAIVAAESTGRQYMLDRSAHWQPHLEEIERELA